jgi:hypothetical protein
MSRPPRPNGPRVYPTCVTQEQLMEHLAQEAQHQTWILAQWAAIAGPRASTYDPITRVRIDPSQDPTPTWKAPRHG